MKKALIVSTLGRGVYLAYQLKKKGWEAVFMDLSSSGFYAPEKEGPFGVLAPKFMSDLQRKALCMDSCFPISQGLSYFTPQGPFESSGKLGNKQPFFADSQKLNAEQLFEKCATSYMYEDAKILNFRKLFQKINPVHSKKTQILKAYENEYFFRERSFHCFEQLKQLLQSIGVERITVPEEAEEQGKIIKNISINKNKVYIESTGVSGEFSVLVWTLGGLESQKILQKKDFQLLFPYWKKPEQLWQRFSLKWNLHKFQNIVPNILTVLPYFKNKALTKDLMSIKKHPCSKDTDIWLLCPYQENLYDRTEMEKVIYSAEQQLKTLFPPFEPIKISFDYNKKFLKSFAVYKKPKRQKYLDFTFPVLHCHPESCAGLAPHALITHSVKILRFLESVKTL